MGADWRFYEQRPTDPIHNPISGEFFSTEAVGDVAEAIVREGIQNSLDARQRTRQRRTQARIRIYVSGTKEALSASRSQKWFSSLWPHLRAPGNGLQGVPESPGNCPYIVFEDFGTEGLTGDPAQYRVVAGTTNHFLNFFRAEGHSDKGVEDRGSWGVGKTVFPRASSISSFMALTVRADDKRRLLFGRSILKFHKLGSKSYKSDGYYGTVGNDGLMMPVDADGTIEAFVRDFRVSRARETGLSIVVPWYEAMGEEAISQQRMMDAVVQGFFYPILMGHLAVTVASPVNEVVLDANTLIKRLESDPSESAQRVLPLARLAEWGQTLTPTELLRLNPPDPKGALAWTPDMIPESTAKSIRDGLRAGARVAIQVPLSVGPRDIAPSKTHFSLFLESSGDDGSKPIFIREELIISDVRTRRGPQTRSLVIVEDAPIASLLRDAETPAHTKWNQDTSHFKNKYKFGTATLKFVQYSVSELFRILNEGEKQSDTTLTADFFSLLADDGEKVTGPGARPKRKPAPTPPIPTPPIVPQIRRFRIDRLRGGFGIRRGDPAAPLPERILVRVAYDVRRGSALKRYQEVDFDLSEKPIRFDESRGFRVRSAKHNSLVLDVTDADFNIDVLGFDPQRDLYVRAEVSEPASAD